MSYPVAIADRRILSRRTCARTCVVYFGPEAKMSGVVRQLDALGARVCLTGATTEVSDEVWIVPDDGDAFYAAVTWRIGATIGVRRLPQNARLMRRFGLDEAA